MTHREVEVTKTGWPTKGSDDYTHPETDRYWE